ncbi:Ig-like domain-containing protein [Alloyangia pacifica]|uniref:Hint domain-containing protein n=1 Tax=Alloyangia pacifica TaxID=311180 RepID=A0A1I6P4H6_9RHOB|nr:Ig-like domain-containing protein [Alloyangia pacifica]SDG18976.1 Hint domain-containing protein [Alloyangia pacifica]SFS35114.1 Hint domain-containing protein [Alloyangia pacifica]
MADLFLNWASLGAFGTTLGDTASGGTGTTVDTGGVNVGISFTSQDAGAEAFTVNYDGYVPEGSSVDPNSHLKLFGEGGDGGTLSSTSTTVFDFSSSNELYTDNVQNLSFVLNDVDGGAGSDLGDLSGDSTSTAGGTSFQDNVTILAYDAEGNPVEVTLTSLGSTSTSDGTATGEEVTSFAEENGTVLVSIAGPVSRIEVIYENGGDSTQGVLISDMSFSTCDVDDSGPVAEDDAAETDEDVAVTIDVLANDSDPDGDALTVTTATVTGGDSIGTVAINEDGTLTFTPAADYNGDAEITYTVEDPAGNSATGHVAVTVYPVNDDPEAVDDYVTTGSGTPVTLAPMDNDTDVDGDTLTITGVGEPANGTVTLNADGTVTYTPNEGHTGEDSFTYTIDDGNGGTDTGTVTVNTGIPTDPTGGENTPPDAVNDLYNTTGTSTATFDPTVNDSDADGDALTITGIGDPTNGTATLNEDGTVSYTAEEGFEGFDSFSYTIDDGNGGTDTAYVTVEVMPCFTPGTLIATPQGERLVEDLKVGDRVITRDNGIQEIRWVGRKELTGFELARQPHLRPVLIQKGALGKNHPEHDLLVSPNHRVLVANDRTALYFEEREVLAAAKHLTGLEGVDEVETMGVAYIHFMFDQHEVVLSNGAWTESFQPGDYTLKGIGDAQRDEIFALFPELEHAEGLQAYGAARRSLKRHEAQLLVG